MTSHTNITLLSLFHFSIIFSFFTKYHYTPIIHWRCLDYFCFDWHNPSCTTKCWEITLPHYSLLWRHNGCDSVSNHQPHDCLLDRLFRHRPKKTSKLRVTGFLCKEFTGDRWIPRTNGQLRGKCFHLMTSSWPLYKCKYIDGTSQGITHKVRDLLSFVVVWYRPVSHISFRVVH